MRHCTCDNTQSDVVIICLCDGKIISVSYVRDESNPAPGSSATAQSNVILFCPEKISIVRARVIRDHNRYQNMIRNK